MITDKMVEAASQTFRDMRYHHDAPIDDCLRAALEAAEKAAWRPIAEAPAHSRVFVSGTQKASGSCLSYRWYQDDVTDKNGMPMRHPDADMFHPLRKGPQDD